jgi:hypothetical protein
VAAERRVLAGRALPWIACVVGVAVAYELSKNWTLGGPIAPLLIVATTTAGLLLFRPKVAVVFVLVLGASVLKPPFASFSIGGVRTDAHEALCYALLALWVWHFTRTYPVRDSVFTMPLLALGAAVVVGIIRGLAGGADPYLVKGQGKTWGVYLVALALIALFRTAQEQDQLERWVLWLCTACSVLTVGGLLLGSPVPNDTPNVPLNTLGVTVAVDRTRPAFLSLLLVAILLLVARCLVDGFTARRTAQLALFLLVEALSYNRASWATIAVCVALIAVLRPGRRLPLRGTRIALALAIIGTCTYLLSSSGVLGHDAQAVTTRLRSVISPQLADDPSYADRKLENRDALRAIERSPVTGVGVGALYGARRVTYRPDLQRDVFQDRPYVHNSFLYLYLQLGLLGVLVMGWIGARVLGEVRRWRRWVAEPVRGARGVAAGVAIAGLAMQSLANTYLLHRPSITALAVCLALVALPVRPHGTRATDIATRAAP